MCEIIVDHWMELMFVQEGGNLMKRVIGILLLILLVPYLAFADLTVHFLDVGQGDSAIIVCDREAMIIDGGLPRACMNNHKYTWKWIKNQKDIEKRRRII